MEECVRMMQHSLRAAPTIMKRAKSVYQQRNLGTIKNRKKEKQQEKEQDVSNGETILRILRMRCVHPFPSLPPLLPNHVYPMPSHIVDTGRARPTSSRSSCRR